MVPRRPARRLTKQTLRTQAQLNIALIGRPRLDFLCGQSNKIQQQHDVQYFCCAVDELIQTIETRIHMSPIAKIIFTSVHQALRFWPVVVAVTTLTANCAQKNVPTSTFKFDSAHNIAVDGVIPAGTITTISTNDDSIKREITEQLYYLIGQLNGMNGGVDMARLEISIGEKHQRGGYLWNVSYAAKVFISWPREKNIPENLTFVIPARADDTGLNTFFATYGADEDGDKKCLDFGAHAVSVGLLWYYYRPAKNSCPLNDPSSDDDNIVARVNAQLVVSGQNTTGKSPEYAKIWEDDKLIVTAIFGKNEAGGSTTSDAGVAAYLQMYDGLLIQFGRPLTNSLALGTRPSAANDEVSLTFNTQSGVMDITIFLVDGIRSVNADFIEKYNARTKISDFVSYSGHSGLGANIRALARMGTFIQGQYQLYFVNGCDTFAYVDNSLRDAHKAANPEAGPDKFFDLITNAMPSYFHLNARTNLGIIKSLIGMNKTYREILGEFDASQRAGVTGEQDNS